ncbi:hypothetical protein FOA52_005072 [Chlamydomonas sp. UWO 241]|nr:hypothetical protein FOA52_005072 [Chlamydomonas sp. UWO 241]
MAGSNVASATPAQSSTNQSIKEILKSESLLFCLAFAGLVAVGLVFAVAVALKDVVTGKRAPDLDSTATMSFDPTMETFTAEVAPPELLADPCLSVCSDTVMAAAQPQRAAQAPASPGISGQMVPLTKRAGAQRQALLMALPRGAVRIAVPQAVRMGRAAAKLQRFLMASAAAASMRSTFPGSAAAVAADSACIAASRAVLRMLTRGPHTVVPRAEESFLSLAARGATGRLIRPVVQQRLLPLRFSPVAPSERAAQPFVLEQPEGASLSASVDELIAVLNGDGPLDCTAASSQLRGLSSWLEAHSSLSDVADFAIKTAVALPLANAALSALPATERGAALLYPQLATLMCDALALTPTLGTPVAGGEGCLAATLGCTLLVGPNMAPATLPSAADADAAPLRALLRSMTMLARSHSGGVDDPHRARACAAALEAIHAPQASGPAATATGYGAVPAAPVPQAGAHHLSAGARPWAPAAVPQAKAFRMSAGARPWASATLAPLPVQ